jgi:hypothetical protein
MKLCELTEKIPSSKIDKFVKLLEQVSFYNSNRDVALSKLCFFILLDEGEDLVGVKLANKVYDIGRVIPVNDTDAASGNFTADFYSNMIVPHFIVDENAEAHVKELITAGVGGISQHHSDEDEIEIKDNFKVIAYKVPGDLINIQISISDVLENLGLTKQYNELYKKALKEKEILAINKRALDRTLTKSDIICFGRKSSGGYVTTSKDSKLIASRY